MTETFGCLQSQCVQNAAGRLVLGLQVYSLYKVIKVLYRPSTGCGAVMCLDSYVDFGVI